jgi:hypothetical protein
MDDDYDESVELSVSRHSYFYFLEKPIEDYYKENHKKMNHIELDYYSNVILHPGEDHKIVHKNED